MKRVILLMIALGLLLLPPLAAAESRSYTETVVVAVGDDEYGALNRARERAGEQALLRYLDDVYRERSATLNMTGEESFIKDLEVLESSVSGVFSRELRARIRVTINEEAVRAYLKRQGAVTGRNEDRRIFVILIPGRMDSGDAPAILDSVRAEIRKNLTAAEYTVIDSEEQVRRLESLTEEPDYGKLVGELAGLGEWVVIGRVDTDVSQDGSMRSYHTMITGKAVSVTSRDLMWEGNSDGLARVRESESPKAALRMAAINGGRSLAGEVLQALNSKTLTGERVGSRYEVVFPSAGDYKLERKILRLLKEEIKGLKNVSQKNRGKGDMVVDIYYVGRISDLADLLLDSFEADPQMKRFSPVIEGNRVVFSK